jgi:hypothetical protein
MKKTKVRKTPKIKSQKKTTRVTVDFPVDQHRRLKAKAALEGVTLQEYIRSHVLEGEKIEIDSEARFNSLMKKILEEDEAILKRLADK